MRPLIFILLFTPLLAVSQSIKFDAGVGVYLMTDENIVEGKKDKLRFADNSGRSFINDTIDFSTITNPTAGGAIAPNITLTNSLMPLFDKIEFKDKGSTKWCLSVRMTRTTSSPGLTGSSSLLERSGSIIATLLNPSTTPISSAPTQVIGAITLTDQYQEWFSGKGKMYDGDEAIITYQLTNTVVTMPDSKVTLEVFYQVESGGYCQ